MKLEKVSLTIVALLSLDGMASDGKPGVKSQMANSETTAILEVVDKMFRALHDRDQQVWREIMHPDGIWFVQHSDRDADSLEIDTTRNRISELPNLPAGITDEYFNHEIRVSGKIATFWAEYRAKDKSGMVFACGTDAFQLVKLEDDWLVANIMFSQSNACESWIPDHSRNNE